MRCLRLALPHSCTRSPLARLYSTESWRHVWNEEIRAKNGEFNYQKLPKTELHRHLEGAVRLRTILEEARRHHIDHLPGVSLKDTKQVFDYFDRDKTGRVTPQEFVEACKEMEMQVTTAEVQRVIYHETKGKDNSLNLQTFNKMLEDLMLAELAPYILTDSPFPNLKSLLDRFDRTQSVFKDAQTFERIAFEAVEDAYDEGIRLLELRYAPSFCSMHHKHSFDMVLDAIQRGVERAKKMYDIQVGLICIAVGAMGHEEMERTVDFAISRKDVFVGFDLAGAETELTQWISQFRRVSDAGIPITCHASEDHETGHPFNAVLAVEKLGACRIGHGVQIVKDKKAMEAMKAHQVLLEVAVSSNYLCGCFEEGEHPAKKLWEYGIPICINTDDPGIMSLDLQGEYKIWHQDLGFDGEQLRESNVKAVEGSFLPKESRKMVLTKHFAD
ncbi:hypothetical protein AAMO2058_000268000 [Amorphochlora amoebiformis]